MDKHNDAGMVDYAEDLKKETEAELRYGSDTRPDILRRFTPDEMKLMEAKLVRRLDFRLLPILIFLFLLNILDRNAIANARLGGLEDDLGLSDFQYQTAVLAVWAGYISMMIPSNMMLSVFKPALYLPTVVAIWGFVAGSTGFTQNFASIVVVRLLTGLTEAPYFVGCIFLLSCWYKRSELPFRISIFYSGYTLSSAFGGLIAAGIINGLDGAGGYRSWRWLFIIEGAATILAAIPAYFILPNYPRTTRWLSAEEAALAEWRLALEADGEEDEVKGSVLIGLQQAVSDPKVWLLVLIQTGAVIGMSFTYFFPSIVQTLGYSRVVTLLLTAPPYFLAFLFSLFNSWHSGKTLERGYHVACACSLSIIGQVVSISTPNIGARYFAFFLSACGSFSAFQIILSWVSSTIPRPKAKRAVSLALCTAISNATNISTAYLYPKSDAPLYRQGGIVLTVSLAVCAISSIILKYWLKRLNSRSERRSLDGDAALATFRYIT
ncbi:retrograde regulation protein 2 [Xylariaceae sp. FL1272]|nr:retrograde regulation protein 2 [Xylariaceae sp. FL1272]